MNESSSCTCDFDLRNDGVLPPGFVKHANWCATRGDTVPLPTPPSSWDKGRVLLEDASDRIEVLTRELRECERQFRDYRLRNIREIEQAEAKTCMNMAQELGSLAQIIPFGSYKFQNAIDRVRYTLEAQREQSKHTSM